MALGGVDTNTATVPISPFAALIAPARKLQGKLPHHDIKEIRKELKELKDNESDTSVHDQDETDELEGSDLC